MAIACPACSAPNPETYTKCRKCNAPLAATRVNPYAPPARGGGIVPTAEDGGEGIWRDGSLVVVAQGAQLPDRCVRCNAPTEGGGVNRTFYWHAPGFYLFILLNLIIYAIVAMIVRKKIKLRVGLCPQHRVQRRNAILGTWLLVILGVVALFIAVSEGAVFGWLGAALLLAAIIWGIVGTRGLSPKRIQDDVALLRGAGDAFLDSLPRWQQGSLLR
jgi:hypothetical protein